ncbi:MAG: hypothetical protein PVG11_03725 [Anaerolineae bacterium]|jgi:hypothetical protein
MKRSEILWLAFEKFAIFFSFAVAFAVVVALLVAGFALWQQRALAVSLKDGIVCDTVTGLNTLLDDFEDAVITRTIHISETIPVEFDLPLDENTTVRLTQVVDLARPATYILPAGGGQINGTVYLKLPEGQRLPIHLSMEVPVRQQLPVEMDVPVAIPLKETDLGGVIAQLRALLAPLQLGELEERLQCPAR